MPRQDLMAAFVGNHRWEGEILRVGVALKGFGIDCKQILIRRPSPAVLRAAGLTVHMPVLDAPDKS
jgi:hypothetical protein